MMKLIGTIIAVLTILILGGCGDSGQNDSAGNQVTVGAVLSLSGNYETYGQGVKRGMDLAIEQINANGGTEFKISYQDTASSIEGARKAFNALAEQGVDIVIGPETTDLAKTLIPMAARNQIILLSPSASSPNLRNIDSNGYFFRICTTDESEADQIAMDIVRDRREKWLKRSHNRALIILRNNDAYTRGLLEAMAKSLGEQNVKYDLISFEPADIQGTLEEGEVYNEQMQEIFARVSNYQVFSENPEQMGSVIIFGFASDVEKLLRAFNSLENNKLRIYTSSAVDTSDFFTGAIDVYEGLIFPRLFDPRLEANAEAQVFVQLFKTKFNGELPDLYAAYGYDAALLIGKTLQQTQNLSQALKDPRNFRLAMNDIDFRGATGAVDFDNQTREVAKLPSLYILSVSEGAMRVRDYENLVLRRRLDSLRDQ